MDAAVEKKVDAKPFCEFMGFLCIVFQGHAVVIIFDRIPIQNS